MKSTEKSSPWGFFSRYTPKERVFFLVKLAVSLALLLFLTSKLDLEALSKLHGDVVFYLLASFTIALSALLIMSYRWRLVLSLLRAEAIRLKTLFSYYLVGAFFNIFVPGAIGGDAMRVLYLSRRHHLPGTKAFLSISIERVGGLFALGAILLVSLLFNDTLRTSLHFAPLAMLGAGFGMLLLLIVAQFVMRRHFPVRFRDLTSILLLSGLGQFGDILIATLYANYLNLPITLIHLMAIMPLVYLATILPISLGGVGVREGTMTLGMGLYGVEVSDAVLVALLLYLTKIFVGLVGLAIYLTTQPPNAKGATPDA